MSTVIRASKFPKEFIKDLQLEFNSTSTVDILAGSCRDEDDTHDIVSDSTINVDITSSGAGGLDTGSEASNTHYFVWIIKNTDSGVIDGILSTSSSSPTMPSGFNVRRLLGSVRNNVGSNFFDFKMFGAGSNRFVEYMENSGTTMRALSAGTAGTKTNVDLSSFVPSISEEVYLQGTNTATGVCQLRPDTYSINAVAAVSGGSSIFRMFAPGQIVEYSVIGGGSLNLDCLGFYLNL